MAAFNAPGRQHSRLMDTRECVQPQGRGPGLRLSLRRRLGWRRRDEPVRRGCLKRPVRDPGENPVRATRHRADQVAGGEQAAEGVR